MFGIFSPEVVQFIDLREAIITFLTSRAKKPGQGIKVRFALPGHKPNKLDLPVRITASRPSQGGKGHVCVGFVAVAESTLESIEEMLRTYAARADLGFAGRRSTRLPISLRVMARELPGFGGVTVDISQHGVRINTHGLVKQGTVINMTIESDVASVENMTLQGRAVWSRENVQGRGFLAGIEFCNLRPDQNDAIDRYCRSLAGRLRGNVMHRQIADGEISVRPTEEDNESDGKASSSNGASPPPPPPPPPPL